MFEYFYNEVFRSVIISFGSLFNGIQIKHKDSSDDVTSVVQVPLAYGPTQKFLARLEQQSDLNKPVSITLPRMSFEFTNLQYDPSRRTNQTQQFVAQNESGEMKKAYLPVPYNMTIELSIYTKLNEDMLQIIEQILPYFQPAYNLPINFLNDLKEKRDVPIVLDNIQMTDDYEGNFDTRRALIYTLTFTAKTYVFGPVSGDISDDIIKKVSVGYIAGSQGGKAQRDLTYQVTPKALKDYNGDTATLLNEDVDMIETIIDVVDGSVFSKYDRIYIGNEAMKIINLSGNKISVNRSIDGSTLQNHVKGAPISKINTSDDALVEIGDDFGFNGNVF